MIKSILYIFNSSLFRVLSFCLILYFFLSFLIDDRFDFHCDLNFKKSVEFLKENTENDFNIFFFSNSHNYTTYDPVLIKQETGLSSVHFGSQARRIAFEEITIKEILKIKRPNIIVLDISAGDFMLPQSEEIWHYHDKFLSSIEFSFTKMKIMLRYVPFENKYLWLHNSSKFLSNIYDYSTKYSGKKDYVFKYRYGYRPRFTHNKTIYENINKIGFNNVYFLERTCDKDICNQEISDIVDVKTEKAFKNLVSWMKENSDVNFILVDNVKINAQYGSFIVLHKWINNLINDAENIDVLDLNSKKNREKLNLKLKDFSDNNHLKFSGSSKVSYLFSQFILSSSKYKASNSTKSSIVKFYEPFNKNQVVIEDYIVDKPNEDQIELRLKFDSDVFKSFKGYLTTTIHIIPKDKFKGKLLNQSKNSDDGYIKISDYNYIDGKTLASVQINSKLKLDEIKNIYIWYWDGKSRVSDNTFLKLD